MMQIDRLPFLNTIHKILVVVLQGRFRLYQLGIASYEVMYCTNATDPMSMVYGLLQRLGRLLNNLYYKEKRRSFKVAKFLRELGKSENMSESICNGEGMRMNEGSCG